MKKFFLIGFAVLVVLIAGAYLAYDSIFPKAEPIKLLKVSETDSICIYDSNENVIELNDSEIEALFIYINAAEPTRIMSVNDYPSARPYYVLEIKSVDRYFRYMIYEDNGKVYVELPYEGVYTIDEKAIAIFAEGTVADGMCEELPDLYTPILKINGILYYDTSETGPMGVADAVEGYIQTSVKENEIPAENEESNFGCVGNAYTKDNGDGWIMVLMEDEEWHIFKRKETVED